MNHLERDRILKTLEDLFIYMGASDEPFDDLYPYPIQAIVRQSDQLIGYARSSPVLSGLIGNWLVTANWIDDDGCYNGMRSENIHWSRLQSVFTTATKQLHALGNKTRLTLADFDSFSRLKYQLVATSGKISKEEKCLFGHIGPNWHVFTDEFEKMKDDHHKQWLLKGAEMLLGMAVLEPTYWIAKVKIDADVPGLSLITDPTGIKELWRFRDIPSGRSRRSSLLNWVSDHWRQDRKDRDVEIYVRKHLRGNTEVTFRGMSVVIEASREADVENLISKREREAMRLTNPRTDRRSSLERRLAPFR